MLKKIPACISPELMAVIMKMGHMDEVVFVDGNFAGDSHAGRIIRADGMGVGELIDASRISAEHANGVLTLNLPKVEAVKPRKIPVSVR